MNASRKDWHAVLVDDEPDMLYSLKLALRKDFAAIHTFSDAREALSFLQDRQDPTLLIVDLIMPALGGVDLLEKLHAQGWRFPAIVLSASQDRDLMLRCQQVGAEVILQKPVCAEVLQETIENVIVSQRERL